MSSPRATGALLLVLTFGCAREGVFDGWSAGDKVQPPTNLTKQLATAKSATLYRVTGEFNDDWEQHKKSPRVGGYPAFAKANIPAPVAHEMADILSQSSSYLRENEAWTCLPQPFYLAEFKGKAGTIHVVVHECGDIEISDERTKWSHGLKPSKTEQQLWALLRQVLPARPNCCPEGSDTSPKKTGHSTPLRSGRG